MIENSSAKKSEMIKRLPKEWPARLAATLFVVMMIAFFAAMIVILKNDLVHKKITETQDFVLDYIGQKGFSLGDIVVMQRGRTTKAELLEALGLKRGDNFLKINLQQLKHRIEQLPWVRDVTLRRSFFPNVLNIEIAEKEVFAIWQLNERFYPLDFDGYVIEADYRPVKPILLVVGKGAAENIIPFLDMIKKIDPSYLPRIKVANYISNRRWNIILDDVREGITIKLPEEETEAAWKKLIELDKIKGILKRKLTIIDLRLKDKITVKLRKSKLKSRKSEQDI